MLQDKYINPYTDFGFMKLFGILFSKYLLIDFLNQLLPKKHHIKDLRFIKIEHIQVPTNPRESIFSVSCLGSLGGLFMVEVRKAKYNFFRDRKTYFATSPIYKRTKREGLDSDISAIYTVGILDFVFNDKEEEQLKYVLCPPPDQENLEVINYIQLRGRQSRPFDDKFTFIYLEMPKFKKTETELKTTLDKWLYVLKHFPDLQQCPPCMQKEGVFDKLFEVAEIAKFSSVERKRYEACLRTYQDWHGIIEASRQEGKQEEKTTMARAMLLKGMNIALIAELTGLSEEQIKNLQK